MKSDFFVSLQSRDLIVDVTDAHCITAAMKYFGLKSPDDMPTKNLPPAETANAKVKKEWIYKCATAILDNYVMADIAKTHPRFEGAINMTLSYLLSY